MRTPLPPPIRNRILLTRCAEQMSQEVLAKKVGASRQTINAIERMRRVPSLHLAMKIAEALSISLDELFFFLKK